MIIGVKDRIAYFKLLNIYGYLNWLDFLSELYSLEYTDEYHEWQIILCRHECHFCVGKMNSTAASLPLR